MTISNIKYNIEEKLNNKFIKGEAEWTQVSINNLNLVDITIVSNCISGRKELIKFIEEILDGINQENNTAYRKGIVRRYTTDEAKELELKKKYINEMDASTFSELIDYNENRSYDAKEEKKKNLSNKIISFYSYKGGVGRTIALIQTAYLMAEKGKRVLLIDLDIEAPSFYDIFKDSIRKEFGMVDYLYDKHNNIDNSVKLEDIISKLNMNLKGEIFLIPAGKIKREYVKKLESLKEKRIYENQYIQEIINEAKEKFNINYTFIDSRTGINNWGALSLIDISNEVMLFAYPNKENIAGIKLIKELIGDHKRTTVVLSRIDASDEGTKTAENLFKELNLEQEYISILYNPAIATANELPSRSIIEPYNVICKFILEEEENDKVSNLLNKNKADIKDVLQKMIDMNFSNNNTSNEDKITEESNRVIICERYIFDKYIKNILISEMNQEYEFDNLFEEIQLNDERVSKEKNPTNLFVEDINGNISSYIRELILKKHIEVNEKNIYNLLWLYIIRAINDTLQVQESLDDQDILQNFNLTLVKDFFGSAMNLRKKVKMVLYLDEIINLYEEKLFEEFNDKIIDEIIKIVNYISSAYKIQLKLVIDFEFYKKYRAEIDEFDTNILKLSWKALDEKDKNNVVKEIKQYIDLYLQQDKIDYYIVKNIIEMDKELNESDFFIDKLLNGIKYTDEVFKIIFGIRSEVGVYSKEIVTWIYEQLREINKLNQDYLIEFIKKAAKFEFDNIADNKDRCRIISLDSMKKSLDYIATME